MKNKLLIIGFLIFNIAFVSTIVFFPSKALTVTENEVREFETKSERSNSAGSTYIDGYRVAVLDTDSDTVTINDSSFFNSLLKAGLNLFDPEPYQVVDKNGDPVTLGGIPVTMKQPGAISSVMEYTGEFYKNPPASGIYYAQGEWNKITNNGVAYAQDNEDESTVYFPGTGYSMLRPIQKYWELSRNIAYMVLILVIIVIAFLIIFRRNFNGQTQVTIANSLPNLVMVLLLITLSYPLSGLMIDVITIGANVAQQVLVQNEFSPGHELWVDDSIINDSATGDNVVERATDFRPIGSKLERDELQINDDEMSIWKAFGNTNIVFDGCDEGELPFHDVDGDRVYEPEDGDKYRDDAAEDCTLQIAPGGTGDIFGTFGTMLETAFSNILESATLKLFVNLVFFITAFMASVRLFFKLITKYVILLMFPIISPFVMLTAAIPGNGTKTIGDYFRRLLGAALSFVVIYTVMLFLVVFINTGGEEEAIIRFNPPLLGYSSGGAAVGASEGVIKPLIAYAIFISLPLVPDMIDENLQIVPPNNIPIGARLAGNIQSTTGGIASGLAGRAKKAILGGQ